MEKTFEERCEQVYFNHFYWCDEFYSISNVNGLTNNIFFLFFQNTFFNRTLSQSIAKATRLLHFHYFIGLLYVQYSCLCNMIPMENMGSFQVNRMLNKFFISFFITLFFEAGDSSPLCVQKRCFANTKNLWLINRNFGLSIFKKIRTVWRRRKKMLQMWYFQWSFFVNFNANLHTICNSTMRAFDIVLIVWN